MTNLLLILFPSFNIDTDTIKNQILEEKIRLYITDVKRWLTGKDPDAGKDWR